MATTPTDPAIDVGSLLDAGSWNSYQKAMTLLAAIAILFDGFDIQVLGIAIPSIMREWHVARAAFAPIAALGLAGMACGSPVAGYCGDRFGRRVTLIGCVLVFGIATIATAFCHGLFALGALRTLAGAGIGGALPNASALTAEFAPLRRRAMAVTLTVVCIPLGGMIAGLAAARVLPILGWRALYLIGGTAPILFALLLLVAMPESPRYLARIASRREELTRVLLRMGRPVSPAAVFELPRQNETAGDVRELLSATFRRDTLGLWLAYFTCLGGIYLVFGWLPALLSAHGLSVAMASNGIAAYNFGGVFGVLVCAVIVTMHGSRGPMLWCSAAGVVSAIGLAFAAIGPAGGHALLIAGIGLHGLFANAVQTVMYALASHVYPTRIRASGIAWAAALGRTGGIFSSLGGAAIIQAGSSTYFAILAMAMAITFVGLAIMRNHCPGVKSAL